MQVSWYTSEGGVSTSQSRPVSLASTLFPQSRCPSSPFNPPVSGLPAVSPNRYPGHSYQPGGLTSCRLGLRHSGCLLSSHGMAVASSDTAPTWCWHLLSATTLIRITWMPRSNYTPPALPIHPWTLPWGLRIVFLISWWITHVAGFSPSFYRIDSALLFSPPVRLWLHFH